MSVRHGLVIVLLVTCALLLCSPTAQAVVVRGYGTANLIGSDLTDPNNNINDNVPGSLPYRGTGYDFVSANASSELYFTPGGGSEGALDLFDNKVGGGEAKWCCNGVPSGAAADLNNLTIGQWVQVTLPEKYALTRFTIASDNDSGDTRDPDQWRILGSNDGVNFTSIFTYNNNGTSPFTLGGGSLENKVLQYDAGIDFPAPNMYNTFRFQAFSVGSSGAFGLSELEFYGVLPEPSTLALFGVGGCAAIMWFARKRRA